MRQGTADEVFTCNGLEWQASGGGGRIIEEEQTISVNNPQAIRARQRAAQWVGSISPPGVVGYREWDSLNVGVAGDAAFMRHWPSAYVDSQAAGSPIRNEFDTALLPGGKAGRVGTLEGWGLAVSRFSAHPHEPLELVRYLTRKDMQAKRSHVLSQPPTLPELYTLPEVPRFCAIETSVPDRHCFASLGCHRQERPGRDRRLHPGSALRADWREECAGSCRSLENELVGATGFKKGAPQGNRPVNRTLNRSNNLSSTGFSFVRKR